VRSSSNSSSPPRAHHCRRAAEQRARAPLFTGTFGTLKARQRSHPLAALLDLQV
jgi:hypothetical protein